MNDSPITPETPSTSNPTPRRKPHLYVYRGEGTRWFQPLLWIAGQLLSKFLSILLFRLRVRGLQHLPQSGPALLVTNHQSFLDPWLIGIAPHRQIHYMARDTLFKGGFFTRIIETFNAFPVKRGSGDRQAIRTAVERLEKGFLVNIFPEGTRTCDGSIGPIAPGVALILNGCKRPVPLIPVVIDGAFEAFPRTAKLPRPKPIRVLYGEPISPDQLKSLSPDELAQRIRAAFVLLQRTLNSPHAAASERRLQQEIPAERTRRR